MAARRRSVQCGGPHSLSFLPSSSPFPRVIGGIRGCWMTPSAQPHSLSFLPPFLPPPLPIRRRWDSWLLDVAICNAAGIVAGLATLACFGSRPYHWWGLGGRGRGGQGGGLVGSSERPAWGPAAGAIADCPSLPHAPAAPFAAADRTPGAGAGPGQAGEGEGAGPSPGGGGTPRWGLGKGGP